MGFAAPKLPTPPPPPNPPTIASQSVNQAAAQTAARAAAEEGRGLGGTELTGPEGAPAAPMAKKTLGG